MSPGSTKAAAGTSCARAPCRAIRWNGRSADRRQSLVQGRVELQPDRLPIPQLPEHHCLLAKLESGGLAAGAQRELDEDSSALLVKRSRIPPDALHDLIERVEPSPHTLMAAIGVGLGGEVGRRGRLEVRIDEREDPVDSVSIEGLEAAADDLEVLGGHDDED